MNNSLDLDLSTKEEINTKLNDLEATMRPIQCSDVKRETLYIKEENKWFKEDDKKEKIIKMIEEVNELYEKELSKIRKLQLNLKIVLHQELCICYKHHRD